ncbi:putative cysteine--tRNA ligase, mitochondrial [Liparis tanakae]|uniref:Probable cysteine--tRNA ligase, mitochondrial n=1 Tax=Liparis tanakae TaxID=230148 RepID=A0A4Z2EVN9_9TELE|nr:putative cysteine--tRNA ligase, mitochondrial [Liparis tanakae]
MWTPKVLRGVSPAAQTALALRSRPLGSRTASSGSGKTWVRPSGFDTGVKTFNSLTKQKEPLIVAREGVATWYSCGPTVYDHAHLGHACSYVRFDILQRILTRMFGTTVIHAMVITDIDDKIIQRGWQENVSPSSVASQFEDGFKRDMLSLKIEPADSGKRDWRDFSLWKRAKPREPAWGSPWGPGRPGWHIECSTIASSVFGSQLDVHSGGVDLAFPHHENEVAQSEAYHQCGQWANYFLHSGHLHLKGSAEKMSKSLKNFVTIKDFLKSYSASEFRMFCLLTKYRSAVDYSDGSMQEARSSLRTVSTFIHDATAYMAGQLHCPPVQEALLWERLAQSKSSVLNALADDFDTPRAIGAVMRLVHHGNRQLQPVAKGGGGSRSPAVFGAIVSYLRDVLDVFGIDPLPTEGPAGGARGGGLEAVVEQLTRFRSEVRAWALAPQEGPPPNRPRLHPERAPLLRACDRLREDLAPLGVLIKDRGDTSTWELTHSRQSPRDRDQDRD